MSEKTRSANKEAEVAISDPTLKELQERYKMDAEIWKKSKRGFPFNIPLNLILGTAIGAPVLASLYAFDFSNQYLWKVYIFTLVMSVIAFFVTDKAIEQFKESLEKNGLFGKDLNKAGLRENKPPV